MAPGGPEDVGEKSTSIAKKEECMMWWSSWRLRTKILVGVLTVVVAVLGSIIGYVS